MAFELKEGEGFLNRDNENPEKYWGSFKVSQDLKQGDTINLNYKKENLNKDNL